MFGLTNSMSVRLTLLYSTCAFLTVVAITTAMFLGLKKNIGQDEANALQRVMTGIDQLLADPVNNATLLETLVDPGHNGDAAGEAQFIRVRDGVGRALFETSGMAETLPSVKFSGALLATTAIRYKSMDGHAYYLSSMPATVNDRRAQRPLYIEAATD